MDKPLNVLFICPTVAHYIGGTETVVGQLAQRMKRKVSLTLLSGDPGNGTQTLIDASGMELITLPFIGRDSRLNHWLSKLLMSSRFKIESYSFFRSLQKSAYSLSGFDVILTFYEADAYLLHKRYPALRDRCRHFLPGVSMRRFFRQVPARDVFFFGYRSAPRAKRKWKVDVQSLPLGVDDMFFPVQPPAFPMTKRLIYVGRLDGSKHVDWLADFFVDAGLAQRGYQLEIIGDGPLQESLLSKHRQASGMIFHGRKKPEEVAALMRHAFALMHPSDHESFGLTILEAMAAGIPVITHELSSVVVWAGSAPRYAAHLDRTVWENELRKLEQPAYWEEVSRHGIELARTFTWDEVTQQVFDLMTSRLPMTAAKEARAG